LAVLIALLLGAGVVAAVVKSGDEPTPVVLPTPTQTFTFDGPPPTTPSTESPIVPTETEEPMASPTETMRVLPRTGGGSFAPAALLTLGIALAGGLAVRRSARQAA
jgi:hypothetical protein